jgi:CTP-dependent riboflavin kinase
MGKLGILLCLAMAAAHADDKFPLAGCYAFDWLKPNKTSCTKITAQQAQSLKQCSYGQEHSFGLDIPAYACQINKRSALIVLPNKAKCQEVFETMQANAP